MRKIFTLTSSSIDKSRFATHPRNRKPNGKITTKHSKKRKHGLCDKQRSARKHRLNDSNQLRRTNYDNIIKIRRKIENITGLQFEPAGNVIKYFSKDVV